MPERTDGVDRFFIDNEIIVDRTTGQQALHLEVDGPEHVCALLNEVAAESTANRYHQRLGAKWMCEAIVRDMNSTFRLNANAQGFAKHVSHKWEDTGYWYPADDLGKR